MAKIKIELGGEYTAGQAFAKAQADSKAFGRETKDMADIAKNSLKEIAGNFGDVGKAAGAAAGVLQGLAQGGIFGVIASLCQTGMSLVIDYFKKAEEEAKKLGEILMNEVAQGFTKLKEAVTGVKTEVADAQKDIDNLVKTAQGKIDGEVKVETAKLHVETLQKITDGMSEAAKQVILADEQLAAQTIKYAGELDKLALERKAVNDRQAVLHEAESKALELVAQAESQRASFIENNSTLIEQHSALQGKANESIESLLALGMTQQRATKYHNDALMALTKFEEEHKDVVANEKAMTETLSRAKEEHAKIVADLAQTDEQMKAIDDKYALAKVQDEATTIELTRKKDEAVRAQQAETRATQIAAEKRMVESAECERRLEWETRFSDTVKKLNVSEEERNELLKVLNQSLEDGCEDAEIEHNLNEELQEVRKRRLKAEGELADDAEKEGADNKAGKGKGGKGISVNARLDASSINQIPSAPDFPNWRKQLKEAARAERDRQSKLKNNTRDVQNWLKGTMPKEYKQQFEQWAMTKLTPQDWKFLGKDAMDKQMLSKKEQEQQKKAIEDMAKKIKQALTVR